MELNILKPEKVWTIVTIGDGMVGKTCLLHRFVDENFDVAYEPTIFDMKEFEIKVGGMPHLVKLYDTAGQEVYDQLRQSFYKDADCFLICFSVDNRTSYNNVIPFWMKEIRTFVQSVPIVLCATKIDTRRLNSDCVTEQEGKELCGKIGAVEYVECSAKTNAGVYNAITTAVTTAVHSREIPVQNKNSIYQTDNTPSNEIYSEKGTNCCCFM